MHLIFFCECVRCPIDGTLSVMPINKQHLWMGGQFASVKAPLNGTFEALFTSAILLSGQCDFIEFFVLLWL